MSAATVIIVRALQDNFSYLLICNKTKKCAVVDPVEPEKVLKAAQEAGVTVTTVLTTHKHWDHAGGNVKIAKLVPGIEVVGGKEDNVPAATLHVGQDDMVQVGELEVRCILTPCHTRGHVLYYVRPHTDAEPPLLFSGDTLFSAGTGRFFDGSAAEMHEALNVKVSSLPDTTLVHSGHEYTLNNLRFAVYAEPDNKAAAAKFEQVKGLRAKDLDSIPTTIGEEKSYNPFMRVSEESIKAFTGKQEGAEVMKALRDAKNKY